MEWISAERDLPTEKGIYLAITEDEPEVLPYIYCPEKDCLFHYCDMEMDKDTEVRLCNVIYWMPLPPEPKDKP